MAEELTVYPEAGDGSVVCEQSSSTWDNVHDESGATGVAAFYTPTTRNEFAGSVKTSDTAFRIGRGFMPFDTSALGTGITVTAATLSIYIIAKDDDDNDGDDWINIVQSTQASTDELVVGDYDACGAVDDPPEGATRIDITALTTGDYEVWTLNATGRGWIGLGGVSKFGVREGHDALDNVLALNGRCIIDARLSAYEGTDSDPKLIITYTPAEYIFTVDVGGFTLTGVIVGFTKGWNCIASVGSFTLTGIAAILTSARSIVASVGAFTLTGIAIGLTKGWNCVASAGSFVLKGVSAIFGGVGSWKTTNQSKSTAITPTNQSQHNIDPTGQSKSSTVTFRNQEKT